MAEKNRREVIKTAAKVAVTAPAISLLLDASTKPAMALTTYAGGGGAGGGGPGDTGADDDAGGSGGDSSGSISDDAVNDDAGG